MAGAHYYKETIAWMDENLFFVDKESNPPNVRQVGLIKNFWDYLARKVYERGWQAANKNELICMHFSVQFAVKIRTKNFAPEKPRAKKRKMVYFSLRKIF